jgi:formylmethanofuran dehydrogenase subunit E
MRSFDELFKECSSRHDHYCAGHGLGVRIAMAGCREVGIDEPRGCKKLLVYVKIDLCATDAIQTVTGCTLGKRTLKFLDYGKMAATFVNVETKKAVRILAKDDARLLVPQCRPETVDPREAQKKACTLMPEEALFTVQPTVVHTPAENMRGFQGARVLCDDCGEAINFSREIKLHGRTLCVACARGPYLPQPHARNETHARPKVVLVVGYKKVGKTTLIEKLIPELSARGYRVGTVKHHHSDTPVDLDRAGTDSWRHRNAGAKRIALVTPKNFTILCDTKNSVFLDQILEYFEGIDIVIAEGFHQEAKPKIEIRSGDHDRAPGPSDETLLAVVEQTPSIEAVPSFRPCRIEPLADLIVREILNRGEPPTPTHTLER